MTEEVWVKINGEYVIVNVNMHMDDEGPLWTVSDVRFADIDRELTADEYQDVVCQAFEIVDQRLSQRML